MRLEDAQKIIFRPYITERTFDQIARENKLCFMVDNKASKTQIASAVEALYEVKVRDGQHDEGDKRQEGLRQARP